MLPQPTTDDLEVRICLDQSLIDEDSTTTRYCSAIEYFLYASKHSLHS